MNYTLGLVSISFREHSPKAILEAIKDTPLTCIEWGSDRHVPPEKAKEVASLQAEYGVTCCSYGTYFRLGVTPLEELPGYIEAAKILGTDILRLWCGDKGSERYSDEEKAALFRECRLAAKLAEQSGVTLCMECHNGTYTDTVTSALQLMQAVNSPHFRMYWQPNQHRSEEENRRYARLIAPYVQNLHVFQWKGKERFSLWDGIDEWKGYLSCFPERKTLLLEFMPDDDIRSLPNEIEALCEIAGGTK